MPFEDYDEEDQQELDAERRWKFETMRASRMDQPALLGRRAFEGTTPAASDSGGFFGGSVSPRVPEPRTVPLAVPTVASPDASSTPSFLGLGSVRPTRPTAYQNYQALLGQEPKRADFDKYKLPAWKQVLGGGLAAIAGAAGRDPNMAGRLATGIFQRPKLKYEQAEQEYGKRLGQAKTAADVEREQAEEQRKIDLPDKTDKKLDEYTNEQQQRVQVMQRADGSVYERVGGKVFEKPEGNFQEQAYQEELKKDPKLTRLQFAQRYAGATQKPERPEKPQRMLGVTPDNRVIELTPGMTIPPGTKSLSGEMSATLKTEQGEEAGKSATAYGNDYLAGGQFTGPGDEALMEKFFEMAKPSSGFRMTQAQIEMLQHSRDLMGSVTAKAKHLFTPEAPWFSDTQRKQIVKTMNDLAKSRSEVKPGATGGQNAAPTSGAAPLPSFKQWKQSQGQGNP